jgi:hypothetical protein
MGVMMFYKRTWNGFYEEHPLDMWDAKIEEWCIGRIALCHQVQLLKNAAGHPVDVKHQFMGWKPGSASGCGTVEEDKRRPPGKVWVSGKYEKEIV